MATDGWRSSRSLERQIRDNCGSFDFFQLTRLLERLVEQSSAEIGKREHGPSEFQFAADLGADFPVSDIRAVRRPARRFGTAIQPRDRLLAMTSNYCIAGYCGPLPEAFANWVLEQQRQGNYAAADFLDIFNHRINKLRYEAGKANKIGIENCHPSENLLADGISSVMGMGSDDLYQQLPLNRRSLMALAGLVANHRVGAHLIQRVLSACFSVKVAVRDMVGAWRDIAQDQWNYLNTSTSRLGELCILGTKTWDMRARIRTRVGPLSHERLMKFLPSFEFRREAQVSKTFTAFVAMQKFLTNRSVDIEVQLEVKPGSVKPLELRYPEAADKAWFRLGQSTWLGTPTGLDRYTSYSIYSANSGLNEGGA